MDHHKAPPRLTHLQLTEAVAQFMRQGGQSIGRFNARQACLYTGLQLEELGEKIDVIRGGCVTEIQRNNLETLRNVLMRFSDEFRKGLHEGNMLRCNHAELIDADFDTAWVSIGALMSTSTQPIAAISHGSFTNLDKFRNGCIKDANGKVQKPADWQPPDFEPFIDKSILD